MDKQFSCRILFMIFVFKLCHNAQCSVGEIGQTDFLAFTIQRKWEPILSNGVIFYFSIENVFFFSEGRAWEYEESSNDRRQKEISCEEQRTDRTERTTTTTHRYEILTQMKASISNELIIILYNKKKVGSRPRRKYDAQGQIYYVTVSLRRDAWTHVH